VVLNLVLTKRRTTLTNTPAPTQTSLGRSRVKLYFPVGELGYRWNIDCVSLLKMSALHGQTLAGS